MRPGRNPYEDLVYIKFIFIVPELGSQKGQELGTGGLIFGLEVGLLSNDNNNNSKEIATSDI